MTIGDRLMQVRKSQKLTQVAFAKKLGVSRAAYVSYELGERDIPTSLTLKLEENFDILATWLLTGKGPKTSDMRDENLLYALQTAYDFISVNDLRLTTDESAKIVHMLWELFNEGVSPDSPTVKRILETSL